MKKFIKNILVFIIILFIINIPLRHITNIYYFNQYEKVDLNYKTYLFSDSHGAALENLTEKYNTYNFSTGSDSYVDILNKINYLIKNSKIKQVIITADDHTLSKYREKMNNTDRSAYYKIITNVRPFKEYLKTINYKYIKRNFVFVNIKSRDIINSYFKSKIKSKNRINKSWNDLTKNEKSKKCLDRFNFQFENYNSSKKLTSTLLNIIKTCNDNNIKITAIKYPITNIYNKTIGTNNFKADSIFKSNGINVIDFKNLYAKNDIFFYDQDHLNEKGSAKFTNVLFNKIHLP